MAHGSVTFTLADTVGSAALISIVEHPTPTVDMRVDYLSAGTGNLRAEAEVVRCGGDVGVVNVDVYTGRDFVAGAETLDQFVGSEAEGVRTMR